jgi:SAM-dependent methyltransferase
VLLATRPRRRSHPGARPQSPCLSSSYGCASETSSARLSDSCLVVRVHDDTAQTWHYGLIATWWAEFNTSGPEIAYFQRFIENDGQPALDAACGTGRLLVPYLRAGLDVDGCDISPDMLEHCRARAEREGFAANLYAQPLHELDLPRKYRTIVVCGGFGIGGNRAHDAEALRRLHAQLEPDGRLVIDNEVPYADAEQWRYWREKRSELPEEWVEPHSRRKGSDGAEYALRSRLVDLDPLSQRITMEMRAWMWREDELVAEEQHLLRLTLYFKEEVVLMLERAGFADIEVRGQYNDAEPAPDDDFLVFVARKSG